MKKIIISTVILGITIQLYAQGDETINGKLDVIHSTGTGTITQNAIKGQRHTSTAINVTSYDKAIMGILTDYDIPVNIKDSGYKIGVDASAFASNINGFAGTLQRSYGVWARSGIHKSASGAKIENAIAVFADLLSSQSNASIVNGYGVYISNGSGATSISNNYGVYQATPVAKNYFAGKIGIGTTSPLTDLHVGNGTADAGIRSYYSDNSYTEMRGYGVRSNRSTFYIRGTVDGTQTLRLGNTNKNFDIVYAHADNHISFANGTSEKVRFNMVNGNVGIGTTTPQSKLSVNGQVRATEVKVLTNINSVPDYVFEPDYELRTLKETKEYITENKHLPEIPSASEMGENGIDLGDMNMRLLKKIEELTLYQIDLMEKLEKQSSRLLEVEKELQTLKK